MPRPADPHARSALIAAARGEFVRSGVQGARIEDITNACRLSKGAFYLHFESKEALLRDLVKQVEAGMNALLEGRRAEQASLIERHGAVKPRDLKAGSPLLAAMDEVEVRYDRQVLELLWQWRDVVNVLLNGAHGTPFAGVIWEVIDREVARVGAMIEFLKSTGLCRNEIPSSVIASTVVGAWLLVVRRMAEYPEKPDFEFWVRAMKQLLSDGMSPREERRRPRQSPHRLAGERKAVRS